VEKSKRKIV